MQSHVNAAKAHILKSQTVESFEIKLAGPDISMILYCFYSTVHLKSICGGLIADI